MQEREWEKVTGEKEYEFTWRLKVDGGWLYHRRDYMPNSEEVSTTMCFVPDVDLQRYQSHLRDAYTQGFKDGQEEAKHNPEAANASG